MNLTTSRDRDSMARYYSRLKFIVGIISFVIAVPLALLALNSYLESKRFTMSAVSHGQQRSMNTFAEIVSAVAYHYYKEHGEYIDRSQLESNLFLRLEDESVNPPEYGRLWKTMWITKTDVWGGRIGFEVDHREGYDHVTMTWHSPGEWSDDSHAPFFSSESFPVLKW